MIKKVKPKFTVGQHVINARGIIGTIDVVGQFGWVSVNWHRGQAEMPDDIWHQGDLKVYKRKGER